MSIYEGFEGYRDPTEKEALALLRSAPIVLDTNVLLDIYGFEEPAWNLALNVLESVRPQLWVPHQAMREFWRNRHSKILDIEPPSKPLEEVRAKIFGIINKLRPDPVRTDAISAMREKIGAQLDELGTVVDEARGVPLDTKRILNDSSEDPILQRLESILEGRVGRPFEQTEEASLIDPGLHRFEKFIPPGYADAENKKEQPLERGTGDFLLWEQALKYIESLGVSNGFVIVSNEAKEDWRIVLKGKPLGIRPELVDEARKRTGGGVTLLSQSDFYRLMHKLKPSDEAVSESLIAASAQSSEPLTSAAQDGRWTFETYSRLLDELFAGGNEPQAESIITAAEDGGFIERSAIYENSGFSEDRSLRRFALPAQRIMLALIEEGLLRDDANPPLEAMYEGSGRTIGYQVPDEFIGFERQRSQNSSGLTWRQAAMQVALTDPHRAWSVRELVDGIREGKLRDLSRAKTPEATLHRDLAFRDDGTFERDERPGWYRLRNPPKDMTS